MTVKPGRVERVVVCPVPGIAIHFEIRLEIFQADTVEKRFPGLCCCDIVDGERQPHTVPAVAGKNPGQLRELFPEEVEIEIDIVADRVNASDPVFAEPGFQVFRDNGGFLPLNDDSAPEEVNRLTQTSKKIFKRSLGMLLKRGAVTVDEQGIKINE